MSSCMCSFETASDCRSLIGAFPQEQGTEPDGRLDYLYHLLDLMEHTTLDGLNDASVDKGSRDGGREEHRPLRVIDM